MSWVRPLVRVIAQKSCGATLREHEERDEYQRRSGVADGGQPEWVDVVQRPIGDREHAAPRNRGGQQEGGAGGGLVTGECLHRGDHRFLVR